MRSRSVPGTASVRPQISSSASAGFTAFYLIFISERSEGSHVSRFALANAAGRVPLNVNRGAQQLTTLLEQRVIAELAPRSCRDEERSVTEVTSGGPDPLRSAVRLNCVPTVPCFLSRRSSENTTCRACRSGSRARTRSRTAFCTTSPLPDQFARPAPPRLFANL